MIYRVRDDWPLAYRDHVAGETFVANLEPDVERRALALGAIEVVDEKRESIAELRITSPERGRR